MKFLWIALGGALGSLARYAVGGLIHKSVGAGFPWGTVVVNVGGCFLFGFVWTFAVEHLNLSGDFRIFALVGFMGAFTTFSTFMFETLQLARDSEWLLATANVVLQNTLGFVALVGGWILGRTL